MPYAKGYEPGAWLLTNSSASLGLGIGVVYLACTKRTGAEHAPVERLYGHLLVHKFSTLLKDEVTALCFLPIRGTQRADQDPFRV